LTAEILLATHDITRAIATALPAGRSALKNLQTAGRKIKKTQKTLYSSGFF
jgi:hypothetical protein